MEKLTFLPNGQWELLEKMSWGSPIYDQLKHGNSPFKNAKTIQNAKTDAVNTIKGQDYSKTQEMPNLQTGKDELHVLLHRGLGGGENNGEIDPAATGPNMLDFSNGKTIKTTHNSIHTSHPDEAIGHAEEQDSNGIHLSHWVPISSIHGSGKFIDKAHNHQEEGDDMHYLVAPGEYRIHSNKKYKNW